jgi:hypothetical protein
MTEESCRICMVNAVDYPPHMICRECRRRMAEFALASSTEVLEKIWRITANFVDRRNQLVLLSRERSDPARPELVASVARGLLEQGYVDDGLVLAALAIQGGEQADVNRFGASALGVMLDPRFAGPDIASTLRAAFYGA